MAYSKRPTAEKADAPRESEPALGGDTPLAPEPSVAPEPSRCVECNSTFSDADGCANVECSLNLAKIERDDAAASRAVRMHGVVAEARACKLCSASNPPRPCSPEHYEAAGYVCTDEQFLSRFGEPLRITELPSPSGGGKCKVLERVHVNGRVHLPGEIVQVSHTDHASAPHCFARV